MIQDFKKFVMRGNVLDLAVAVVIGAAFNAVVQSLVKNIVNPITAAIVGKPNFSKVLIFTLRGSGKDATQVRIGSWITDIVSFIIVAFSIFIFVKAAEKLQNLRQAEADAETPAPSDEAVLLTEIRDLLAARAS